MIQYRRLSALLLGIWLGAGMLTDVAVTQNFQTVDRFLQTPGSIAASVQLSDVGKTRAREILRRNAAEENNWIFENWERAQMALGALLFLLLLFGSRPQKLMLGLCLAMFAIVVAEHFLLTPQLIDLGRRIDNLPPSHPDTRTFWTLHGVYSGLEILKLVVGLGFAARLAVKGKVDKEMFVREHGESLPAGARR